MLHEYHITCGDLNVFFLLVQGLFANMDEWVVYQRIVMKDVHCIQ